jgi:hypothetical protein
MNYGAPVISIIFAAFLIPFENVLLPIEFLVTAIRDFQVSNSYGSG